MEELERSDYEKLYAEEMKKSGMIHGEYNYHNIIMTKEGIATTNFEKFRRDIQVEDLYYFLRKVLEKSGWKIRLGDGMLNAYSAIHPLTEERNGISEDPSDLSGKILENGQFVLLYK